MLDNGQVNKYASIGLIIKNLFQLQENIILIYFQTMNSLLEVATLELKTIEVFKILQVFILELIGLIISKEKMDILPEMPNRITSIILRVVREIKTLQFKVLNFIKYQIDF